MSNQKLYRLESGANVHPSAGGHPGAGGLTESPAIRRSQLADFHEKCLQGVRDIHNDPDHFKGVDMASIKKEYTALRTENVCR